MIAPSRWRLFLPYLPLVAALAGSLAYWPGLVTWDSLRQYDQATSGAFDDWHPPAMEWIWRQFLAVAQGPAPMLLLQLALFGTGFALLIRAQLGDRRRGWATLSACCALQPIMIALMATIIKDSLMTGALLCAVGLVMTAEREDAHPHPAIAARSTALLLCLFAATLRFNALPAALPIAFWALPPVWRSGWRRGTASAALLALPLLAAMPVANALIGVERSDVALSLVIFDLGGMSDQAGIDLFPALGLRDAVAVNHQCYNPARWDSYSWWVDKPCPIGFEAVRDAFHANHRNPWLWWLSAVVHHPLAYLAHRARHWNINARFIVSDEVERPVQVQAPPNEWGFAVTPNALVRGVDAGARATSHSPLGWPCVWMAALAALLWRRRHVLRCDLVTVLALSALLYGLGYALASVASELRYYLWTYCAGALALAGAAGDRTAVSGLSGMRAVTAAALPIIVALICVVARLAG